MTTVSDAPVERSYGCTFGCGNPYDYILVTVADGSTEFVCVPCFIRLAADMIEAITNPDNPEVAGKLAVVGLVPVDQAPGPKGKRRGRNAPATSDDPSVFAAFDSRIMPDELPEEFR